jgi:hypothetical protein
MAAVTLSQPLKCRHARILSLSKEAKRGPATSKPVWKQKGKQHSLESEVPLEWLRKWIIGLLVECQEDFALKPNLWCREPEQKQQLAFRASYDVSNSLAFSNGGPYTQLDIVSSLLLWRKGITAESLAKALHTNVCFFAF